MNIQSQAEERTGVLRIIDGIKSDQKARKIKAVLGDLPGVLKVEVIGFAVRICFDPAIVSEQQFYQAIETAGFKASGFQPAACVKTLLLAALTLVCAASTYAVGVTQPYPPKPPCCREGLPPGKYSETSVYKLDSIWTSDVRREVKLEVLRGHPQVLALFFTNCGHSCPLIVADMKNIEKALPRDVRSNVDFLLVSIDPKRDTPEALQAYRAKYQLGNEHWTLLRGSAEAVKQLADKVGFQYSPGSERQFGHSLVIPILDANGEIVFQQAGVGALPNGAVGTLVRITKKGAKGAPRKSFWAWTSGHQSRI